MAFFLLGVGASGQSIAFAVASEYCKENYLAVGLGFNNAIICFFTSLNAPLIGWVIKVFYEQGYEEVVAYQQALSIIIVFFKYCIHCLVLLD